MIVGMCWHLDLWRLLVVVLLVFDAAAFAVHPVCPSDYVSYEDRKKCYKIYHTHRDWFEANNTCKQEGDSLVTIPDNDTDIFIEKIVMERATWCWIGLKSTPANKGQYNWVNGNPMTYNGFARGQPNKRNSLCVAQKKSFGWNDILCSDTHKLICERDFYHPVTCPDGWVIDPSMKKCYMIEPNSPDWEISRSVCQEKNGDLATFPDEETRDNMFSIISSTVPTAISQFWIGLWDRYKDGNFNFEWVDGNNLNRLEPTRFTGVYGEHCATLQYTRPGNVYTYLGTSCRLTNGISYPSICHRDVVPYYPFLECPSGYTVYNTGHGYTNCLKIVNGESKTWNEAAKDCRDMSANLFTFKEDQNDLNVFVRNKLTVPHTYWIARYDKLSKMCLAFTYNTTSTEYEIDSGACYGTNQKTKHQYVCQNFGILRTDINVTEMIVIDPEPVTPESVDFLKNTTSPKNKTHVQNKLCPCRCQSEKFDLNPPPEVLAQMISKIQKELKVDKKKLILKRSKKISAKDDRTGSMAIGYLSIILSLIPFVLIVAADIMRFFQHRNNNNNN